MAIVLPKNSANPPSPRSDPIDLRPEALASNFIRTFRPPNPTGGPCCRDYAKPVFFRPD